MPQVVLVTWGDAHAEHGAITPEEARKIRAVKRQATGWLVSRNRHGIVIATDMDEEESGEVSYSGWHFIGRSMLISVKPLKSTPRRRS